MDLSIKGNINKENFLVQVLLMMRLYCAVFAVAKNVLDRTVRWIEFGFRKFYVAAHERFVFFGQTNVLV